jgi:hypothetical protein
MPSEAPSSDTKSTIIWTVGALVVVAIVGVVAVLM